MFFLKEPALKKLGWGKFYKFYQNEIIGIDFVYVIVIMNNMIIVYCSVQSDPPPWNQQSSLLRGAAVFLMSIFEVGWDLKIWKRVPLFFPFQNFEVQN